MYFFLLQFTRKLTVNVFVHIRSYTMNLGFEENKWRGVPLSEIYGSQSPWGAPEFSLVTPSHNHAVLYHVPNTLAGERPPKPQVGREKWDHNNVRMPCSTQSLYPVEDNKGETHLKKRWEIIENSLNKPIRNSQELANAIISYNTKFKNIWKFRALHQLFNEELEPEESLYFFDVTLPEIAKLALSLPKLIQSPIPLLKQQTNSSVSLSQQQIASLLANAFFCTFPRRNTTKKASEYASYPYINFNSLYEHRNSDVTMEKLKCLCHYFKRVCTKVPVGVVSFSRRSVNVQACPKWQTVNTPLATLPLHADSSGTIEDAHGLIQLDFANKYLGGGVLGHGSVQEEIRFLICPELMVSMLFIEAMKPNEAVMIIGTERYSKYDGYGNSFRWAGDYEDKTPFDSSGRRRCAVLAIDALPSASTKTEYTAQTIDRELNKAWIGFSFYTDPQSEGVQYPGLATGNWGCGAFGGCPRLKSLIQLMAASHAGRPMAYYTFGDKALRDDLVNVYNLVSRHNLTVGQLYKYLLKFTRTDIAKSNLYTFLRQELSGEEVAIQTPLQIPEMMDTSITSDAVENEISDSLEREFLKKDFESPDLFSDDDMDISLVEVKVDQPSRTPKSTDKEIKEKRTEKPEFRTSLIDAVKKLDNEKGNSPQSSRLSLSCVNPGNETPNKNKREVTEDLKKKVNKKITDYFAKK